MNGGSLEDYLKINQNGLKTNQIKIIIKQIL